MCLPTLPDPRGLMLGPMLGLMLGMMLADPTALWILLSALNLASIFRTIAALELSLILVYNLLSLQLKYTKDV